MKIGVIGCGYVFDHYMTTRARHTGLHFAGVTDIDRPRAERAGEFYGLRIYDSTEQIDVIPGFDVTLELD